MRKDKNTKTHNIYLLDKSKMKDWLAVEEELSTHELLERLMAADSNYVFQTLKENIDTDCFEVELYFRKESQSNNKFISFCTPFVAEGQDAVSYFPRTFSSVMFVWDENNIFAITTNQGYRIIENYVVPKFGLIIASAFEQRFKVTSLDSNAMSSIVHSTKTIYSNEIDFIDVDALDTIFKEVTGRLNDTALVHHLFNLKNASKRKSTKVIAKNHLQFGNSLNFSDLLHLLKIIGSYNFENLQDRFNLITPITQKKNPEIISANKHEAIHAMYEAIKNGRKLPFDLFHKNTNKYIAADNYIVYSMDFSREYTNQEDYESSNLLSDAFENYLNGAESTEAAFSVFANSVKIRSEKNGYIETDAPLLEHISGEVCVEGINYYVFYGEYYRLNSSYNERLKEALRGKLRPEFITTDIQTPWTQGKDEDWFNENVSVNEGYAHLHKIKPEYIEFGDLLKCNGDIVTIVHVKDGFDGEMRILDRQVELSITKLMDLKHNNNSSYMRKLYQNAAGSTTGINITSLFPTEQDFIDCLKSKRIRYVIAIRPTDSNLLESRSNIAKHCLNAMILRCFNQGIDLNIQTL